MIQANEGKLINMPAATAATSATQSLVFDAKGYDQANVMVNVGTHSTSGTTLQMVKMSESDTATLISSQSSITALSAGTSTSSTAAFAIPVVTILGRSSIIEFQIDLRKRKRYLALQVTPGTTTVNVGAIVRLTRSKKSADSAAEKSVNGTNHISVTQATSVSLVMTA